MSEKEDIKDKNLRVVIDTGVWISFLIGKALVKLKDYLKNENIILLFSDELLDELVEVLHRPKIKKYIKDEQIDEIIGVIHYKAEWVKIKDRTDICRDIKDNFLLDLAGNGNANYLITGDEDLLVLKEFKGAKILNFWDFDKLFSKTIFI
jgi:putative PIN family toxin of toxin-antitoxin system